MGTLHSILTELGIEYPAMHGDPEYLRHGDWISDQVFQPVSGQAYEVVFRQSPEAGRDALLVKRVRTDAASPEEWYDLDSGATLSSALHELPVVAFRPLV